MLGRILSDHSRTTQTKRTGRTLDRRGRHTDHSRRPSQATRLDESAGATATSRWVNPTMIDHMPASICASVAPVEIALGNKSGALSSDVDLPLRPAFEFSFETGRPKDATVFDIQRAGERRSVAAHVGAPSTGLETDIATMPRTPPAAAVLYTPIDAHQLLYRGDDDFDSGDESYDGGGGGWVAASNRAAVATSHKPYLAALNIF